jgi:hypothetical protein
MVGLSATPAAAAPKTKTSFTTVATGFDNPRGLAFGEDGQLYVAEAGKGGASCTTKPGPEGPQCFGLTSAISVIGKGGAHKQIVTGLASISGPGGLAATGADGLSRNEEGGLYTIMTSCPQQAAELFPDLVPPLGATDKAKISSQVGQVIKVKDNGGFKTVANVGGFDWDWSLDHTDLVSGQFPDCNPYGILAGEHDQWVVDAATNTLDHVNAKGGVEVKAFIPNPPSSDAVPTCVAQGPDGALYISQLTGGGNGPGAANVWRYDIRKGALDAKPWATGLTAVTGCGFVDGKFYATEFSVLGFESFTPGTGAVVRVPKGSTKPIVVADGLSFPNGFAGTEGAIYVSNFSIAPAVIPPGAPPFAQPGEVVKVSLHHGGEHGGDD